MSGQQAALEKRCAHAASPRSTGETTRSRGEPIPFLSAVAGPLGDVRSRSRAREGSCLSHGAAIDRIRNLGRLLAPSGTYRLIAK